MNKKYKIGDISKLLNIPVQTLRFYEEKKIISPSKDDKSGYRYYDAWTINDLMDALILRKCDFSLQQTESIIKNQSLDNVCEEFDKKEEILLDKMDTLRAMLDAVSTSRMKMQNFKYYLGKVIKCKNPDLVFHRYREKDMLQTSEKSQDLESLSKELTPWIEALPAAIPTFYIPFPSLNHVSKQETPYWWGFSIAYELSSKYYLQPGNGNEYIPSVNAIYTVFEANEEGTFINSFYEQVYTKIVEEGYIISGSPFGRLIAKTQQSNTYRRYFEVWVPIN
ncbi:MerR family transcriptional regulator [Enterococcus sp. AZ109]|uniref:MerR family transcriptional regulator n=1 Tax=Enterococcus sp. AZ109 TaxID=2774634 RepID=UPI003F1E9C6B